MQTINSDPNNILISASIGVFLSGTWLLYNLGLFRFISINDEKKILIPTFLFVITPFLFPFLFTHPLPGALPSLLPVTTFIIGQLLAESNNKKQLSEKEKEIIHQLHAKLSFNFETAKKNESYIKNYITREPSPCYNDLTFMEDIKEDSIKLVSFQGLIPEHLRLVNNNLIVSIQQCARIIDKFNIDLAKRKINEKEIEENYLTDITHPKKLSNYRIIKTIDVDLLDYTNNFLSYQDKFSDMCIK
ncbi:hypothetical protein Q5691_26960 [Microcoleus sp. w1-18aA5]|uniref:hypothetical protein n=1 Tax=Microcoleus sp. w1-18aA5 TaxID=2818982 RepID=UPI002FD3E22B